MGDGFLGSAFAFIIVSESLQLSVGCQPAVATPQLGKEVGAISWQRVV
jgi:hypothetical protein